MTSATRRNVLITDLDQSDTQIEVNEKSHDGKTHKKRTKEKVLHTVSGNFSRRSHSAEGPKTDKVGKPAAKRTGYLTELLQTKDQQMEKLVQRLTTLHEFNEQFAEENQRLHNDVKCLEQRIAALQFQIEDCDKCHRLDVKVSKLIDENKLLAADLEMLKTLVYRLNVQIERYQDCMRLKASNEEPCHKNAELDSSISQWQEWPLQSHTLSPLLQAYDEMISEKEFLIQQYTKEFDHFTGELKTVIEENNRLHQEIDKLKQDGGNWREERTRLQAQLEVCRQRADVQTRKTDLAKQKLVEVMHCYEQKIQMLVLDMEHLQGAYTRCKAELASLKSFATLPQDTIASSLQECKELLEQLRQQHTKEKNGLEHTIAALNERNSAINEKLDKLKLDNSELKLELEKHTAEANDLRSRNVSLQRCVEKVKRSRDRLKARLRIALQWARKLEEGQANLQSTWDALRRLEAIVKHKEAQVRGLHDRHLQEIDKLEKKLAQKEETIRTILRDRLNGKSKQ